MTTPPVARLLLAPLSAVLLAAALTLMGCMETETTSDQAEAVETPADAMEASSEGDFVADGRTMYMTYCANCHGPEGKGDGPVAELLTVPPPDLTRIRARHGGSFPVDDLYTMIDGREEVPAHGTREMPIWGNAWRTVEGAPQSEETVRERINLLIEYLRSIQVES